MSKILVFLFTCGLCVGVVGAEQVNLILKSGEIEHGNLIKTDELTVVLEGRVNNRAYALEDIEAIFNAMTKKEINQSELWKYNARNSISINALSSALYWPTAEFEFVLSPIQTIALRAGVNMQFDLQSASGGLSLRFYPYKSAPRKIYFGGRADILGGNNPLLYLSLEVGQKHYFENGFMFGYFYDVGAPISLKGDDLRESEFYFLHFLFGGGILVGFSF